MVEPRVVKKGEDEREIESEAEVDVAVEEENVERPVIDQSIMDFYELKGE